ncbi:MAG TPA: type II CAAX endopeptidase family protein [Anaerolineales bacterium]|nr:type II CAAX endopeptidase family protein [Anaerolineales bacterium]
MIEQSSNKELGRTFIGGMEPSTQTNFLRRHSLVTGIVLMFIYTWTIDLSNSGVLPFKVPFVVALTVGWGFIFVSLFMTWLTLGREAMKTLFKRFFLWRVDWKWYLVAILLMPALRFAAIPMTAWLTGIPADYSHPMIRDVVPLDWPLLSMVIPWVLFEIFTNGEEMGWRGYVLPRLQSKFNALVSSLILGVIWSVWHLPKFFGTGSSEGRSFFWFTVFTVSVAVLYTWLYNNTHGSLLLVVLFHASGNTVGQFLPAKFAVAGGILSNLEIVFFFIAAIVVTMVAGADRLSRTEEKQMQK